MSLRKKFRNKKKKVCSVVKLLSPLHCMKENLIKLSLMVKQLYCHVSSSAGSPIKAPAQAERLYNVPTARVGNSRISRERQMKFL